MDESLFSLADPCRGNGMKWCISEVTTLPSSFAEDVAAYADAVRERTSELREAQTQLQKV